MTPGPAVPHPVRMQDMALCAVRFSDGVSRERFLADQKTSHACLFNLLIIGECSACILREQRFLADQFSTVPWPNMKGMRNQFAHGFWTLDLDTIWATLYKAVPDLILLLPKVLEAARKNNTGG